MIFENNQAKMMTAEDVLPYIAMLPKHSCDILKLYYEEGLSQDDIAKKLEVPLYSVKTSINKALYLVRKMKEDPVLLRARKILYRKG